MYTNLTALKERVKKYKELTKEETNQIKPSLKLESAIIPEHRLEENNLSLEEKVKKFNDTFALYKNHEYYMEL